MDERYAVERYEQAAALLPVRYQRAALAVPDWQKAVCEELRLRVGHPVTVLLPEGEAFMEKEMPRTAVTQGDLEQLCDTVTGYSRYAACDTLGLGYLTAKGGFRIGLCGTTVMQNGEIINMRDFSSAVIRISRERHGLAEDLLPQLIEDGRFHSTLIYSPPGGGKTTLLRDLIALLSDGTARSRAFRVAVADERGEIAVKYLGKPQMAVGCHTDVIDGCPKALAIPILLRSANPQIIAVDEITQKEDLTAMACVANCGVSFLATIHAADKEELLGKPLFSGLTEMSVFERGIRITCREGNRHYEVEKL